MYPGAVSHCRNKTFTSLPIRLWFMQICFKCPASVFMSVNWEENRHPPPRRIISSRMALTIWHRTSVPMWGLFSYMISGLPLNSTKSSRDLPVASKRILHKGIELPSEKYRRRLRRTGHWFFHQILRSPRNAGRPPAVVSTSVPRSRITGR